jgi:DNA-binding NtrC family response regulator
MQMRANERILVVDDEISISGAMKVILGEQGYEVKTADTVSQATSILNGRPFDLVFTDLKLPDASGIDLLGQIKSDTPDTEVILMTAHGSLDITIEAIKRGAYYYIEKPFVPDQVVMLAQRALESAAFRRENQTLKRVLSSEDEAFGIIGRSPKMRQIYDTIRATAAADASVLIEGESGTGKELIARAFHLQGTRSDRPFVCINCAAIPRDLIESELFGYKKGAFTGADRDKRGLMETASGGTLLLDEIGEMPVHLQTKLLRVLQQRKLRRVGDEQEVDVDFKLISATNRDTLQAIQQGELREDLYYRISTIKIKVPPLRERLDDLVLLAERFLERYSKKYNKHISGIAQTTYALLTRYPWPGNVRELESVVEHAVLFCQGEHLEPKNLPEHIQAARSSRFRCDVLPYMTLDEIERDVIEQTLERTGGNVKKTAEILNLHRPTLYRKLRSYGIKGKRAVS